MDRRDLLKSMLQNFINDKADDAKQDFHQYLTVKSKEITGLGSAAQAAAGTATGPVATPEGSAASADAEAEPASATQG